MQLAGRISKVTKGFFVCRGRNARRLNRTTGLAGGFEESQEHESILVNPTLARPVYLAGYIEQLGTGTTDLINHCLDFGLKRPEFRQDENFVSVIWRGKTGENSLAGHVKTTVQRLVLAIGGHTITRKEIMEKLALKGRG